MTTLAEDQFEVTASVTVQCANSNVLQTLIARSQANPQPNRSNVSVDQTNNVITFTVDNIGSILDA